MYVHLVNLDGKTCKTIYIGVEKSLLTRDQSWKYINFAFFFYKLYYQQNNLSEKSLKNVHEFKDFVVFLHVPLLL